MLARQLESHPMKRSALFVPSAIGAGLLLALAAPLSASAHVTVDASSTAAGSYSLLTFGINHGCEGSATTSVEISLPESIDDATATVNPNWTISKSTDGVAKVVFTAITPLAADQRDDVAIQVVLAGDEGDVLEFPVIQTCEVGVNEWIGDEVPAVTLTAASTDDHGSEAAHEEEVAHEDEASEPDLVARGLGIAGLVLGAVALVVALSSRRSAKP
jgi:periplasmic copper chaperone A